MLLFSVYCPLLRQYPELNGLAARDNLLNFIWSALWQSPGLDGLAGLQMTVNVSYQPSFITLEDL